MKGILFYFTLLLTARAMAQPHYYELRPDIPPEYNYNSDSLYKKLTGLKDIELSEKVQMDYAASLAYYHERMLHSGYIYFEWKELEDYVNSLVKKIATSIQSEKEFKVYLMRSEDVNASAQDNGIIYIYIGLLAEIKDEAALISVLAHEISHAIHSDTKKNFIAYSRQSKRRKIKDALSMSHENRKFEARADSLGFEVASGLNYDLTSSYHIYAKFESDYRWYKSQYSYQDPKWYIALDNVNGQEPIKADSLEKYLLDHPENSRRLTALNEFIKKANGQNKFSGNEIFFNEMKYKARMEQLYIDFTEASYDNCLRNAFYYHLQDQNDKNYLYYITECLRRMILVNPDIKRRGFLTEDSKEELFEKNKGILHDVTFISLDTVFCATVKNDPVYGAVQKPFETYLQAYNYFYKKAKDNGGDDLLLTAGLFELNRNKKEKGLEYLKQYTSENPQKYQDFLTSVFSGSTLSDLQRNTNDYVYIETADYFVLENGSLKYNYLQSSKISDQLLTIFNNFEPSKDYKVTLISADLLDITNYNLFDNLALQLKQFKPEKEADAYPIKNSAQDEDYWKAIEANDPLNPDLLKRNKNFFYYAPDYWNLFKDKQIHSFTHIRPYFYRHKLLGTLFYFEIEYFDPVNRKYFYFDQEYAERYTDLNLNKVFKRFSEKLKN